MYVGFLRDQETGRLKASVFSRSPRAPAEPSGDEAEQRNQEREGKMETFESLQVGFFELMHAFLDMLPTGAHIARGLEEAFISEFEKGFLKPKGYQEEKDGDWVFYNVPDYDLADVKREFRFRRRGGRASKHLPQLGLMGLISQFDAYMGRLLRLAIQHKSHIVVQSQKTFPAHEVLKYSSFDDFKEAVVEKEIEDFLRKSHEEQFEWLKDKFKVKTKEGLEHWPEFIEACERRNLFAHSSGVVSQQYIIKCDAVGYSHNVDRGDQLLVDRYYLSDTCKVLIEIGVKLAQVISRKVLNSEEQEVAGDRVLNEIAYSLIEHEHYDLALTLLDFACNTIRKHPDATLRHMMIINRANCYKFLGEEGKCEEILDSIDWQPYDGMFRISVMAIKGDVAETCRLMRHLKHHDTLNETAYRTWPVFHWVRSDEEFERTFFDVFSVSLLPPEHINQEVSSSSEEIEV